MRIAAVVLAAGDSKRLGRPKQLVRVAGVPLVRRTVERVGRAGFSPVVVVVGAAADRVAVELEGSGASTVENADWASGLASSIRAGVEAVGVRSEVEAVLLVPCDLPRLDVSILKALAGRFEAAHAVDPAAVVACSYAGTIGTPALFGRSRFERLGRLRGETGARGVLEEAGASLVAVDWPDGALDVDLPGDLEGAGL